MLFKPLEPNIEVNGNTVQSVIKGFGIVKSLARAHFRNADLPEIINAEEWYSQEKWLKSFEGIVKLYGEKALYNIGLQIPKNATFPAGINSIETAIQSIDIAYHLNHRKNGKIMFDPKTGNMTEGIGHYGFNKIENQNLIISVCDNPYPCDFDLGILTCMARLFKPKAKVLCDPTQPCRKTHSQNCTYLISW